jgi:hypothetical protein
MKTNRSFTAAFFASLLIALPCLVQAQSTKSLLSFSKGSRIQSGPCPSILVHPNIFVKDGCCCQSYEIDWLGSGGICGADVRLYGFPANSGKLCNVSFSGSWQPTPDANDPSLIHLTYSGPINGAVSNDNPKTLTLCGKSFGSNFIAIDVTWYPCMGGENGGVTTDYSQNCPRLMSIGPLPDECIEHDGNQTYTLPDVAPQSPYPNPANESIKIGYRLQTSGSVTISIYSASGQLIETAENEHEQTGDYEATLATSQLRAGAYLCVIYSGRSIKSWKFDVKH